jgi:hypothetical protein
METQEINAKVRRANAVAQVLRVIGVLFFLAMAFGIMSWKWAIFLGTACFVLAPAIRQLLTTKN